MARRRRTLLEARHRTWAIFAGSGLLSFALFAALAPLPGPERANAQGKGDPDAALKAAFVRPKYLPSPASNPPTPAKVALGRKLFFDKEFSATGTIACASCHDPRLAFTDGEPTGRGVTNKRLLRHTPTLWNVAWSPLLFWDGRAPSLETQVRFPVEHPDEMGDTLDNAVFRLSRHESYERAFAEAFPSNPEITPRNISLALAAYERTLVSPPTRFDAWVAGNPAALSQSERRGFAIFTGKGRCAGCHTGFAFTDNNFYDIGLPGEDLGRGAIIGLEAADHAFKTPTLRELAWTAPYMHDGSLATLEDVVRHYESGGVPRPTRSRDLPANLHLTDAEREDLVAFLETLSSDAPPEPSQEPWVANLRPTPLPPPVGARTVSQANKTFAPSHVSVKVGESLRILNDDTRTHNVRIFDPRFDFNSGAQEPRETVTLRLPVAGTFQAFCGIHPSMRLTIEVK